MRFGQLEWLWLMWLVPLLIGFCVMAARSKEKALALFAVTPMMARLTRGVSVARQRVKIGLLVVGVLSAVIALCRPQYGFAWEEIKREGVDIVIALDVSDSMLVEDVQSDGRLSRLQRAKREITDLLRMLKGDRIGLVAFAGTAFVECPLTLDYNAAEIFLDTIDTDLIPIKGTHLGEAITTSVKAFKGGATEKNRALILITDGEDNEGQALRAAEQAKAAGVTLFAIGIGRDEGAPIPHGEGGFRRDNEGNIILSKLDERTLQQIASMTGGTYVHSSTGDMDLEQIYTHGIRAALEAKDLGSQRRQHWHERFQWFLLITWVVWMIEALIPERAAEARVRTTAAASLPSMLLVAVFLAAILATLPLGATAYAAQTPAVDPHKAYESGEYTQALEGFLQQQVRHPNEDRLLLNIGSAQYKLGQYDDAAKSFTKALQSTDQAIRAHAEYNLGNVHYRQNQLDEAVKHYQNAIRVAPNDKDAKANLAYVQYQKKKREQQQQQEKKDQDKQDNKQGQNQDQQSTDQQKQDQKKPDQQQTDPDPKKQDQQQAQSPSKPDAQQQDEKTGKAQQQPDTPQDTPKPGQQLSEAEAMRYLNALEEHKPARQQPLPKGARRVQPTRDW